LKQHQTVDCDECGQEVSKLWRRHKGHGYCSTCYARVFKRRMCPRCGELARLPKNDLEAVCRQCDVDKPCARCGKASSDYNIGKVTPYGPVCIACAPYFREPEPCEACGESSQRLTRVKRMGHDHRLCPRCATADHGTCSACRRHRLLVMTSSGDALCKACYEQGEIACPSCGHPMPAGRGDVCEPCYWTRTCRKRISIGQAGITTNVLSKAFGEFGEWLIRATGPHKAALKINHFFSFFLEIDQAWSRIPSYSELLHHFGAEGLRRVRLPMRWLHDGICQHSWHMKWFWLFKILLPAVPDPAPDSDALSPADRVSGCRLTTAPGDAASRPRRPLGAASECLWPRRYDAGSA